MALKAFYLATVLTMAGAQVAVAADGHVSPKAASVAGFLDCMREHKAVMVTAHRGGVAGGLAENSMEAMAFTAAHIPTLMEVDVQRSKDGVLFLMHDDRVDRTTTGTGKVADLTWAQLADLKLVNHAGLVTPSKIATLDQALEWARGRAVLQLDVKRDVPLTEVIAAVRKAKAQSYALIIVYTIAAAKAVAAADPTISINVNLADPQELKQLEAAGVSLDRITAFAGIDAPAPDYWAQLHAKGVSVSYGVLWKGDMDIAATGDDDRYARLGEQGADILVTDRHFEAFRAVERRRPIAAGMKACAAGG